MHVQFATSCNKRVFDKEPDRLTAGGHQLAQLPTVTESVFAYFGETSDDAIKAVFRETFEKSTIRIGDSWSITISTGHKMSVCRMSDGRNKFVELFGDFSDGLNRIDKTLAAYLTGDAWNVDRNRSFENWLDFRMVVPPSLSSVEGYVDLRTLKDNFLELFNGIAIEHDNLEATVRHPCGGIWGDYLF